MVVVIKKKGESKDNLFRKFSRSFIEENILEEIRNRLFYKKPSLVKKEKKKLKMSNIKNIKNVKNVKKR